MKKKGFAVLAVLMLSMLLSVTAFAKGKWKVEEGNRYYYNEDGTKQKRLAHTQKRNLLFSAKDRDHGNRCAADRQERPMYFQKRDSAEGI